MHRRLTTATLTAVTLIGAAGASTAALAGTHDGTTHPAKPAATHLTLKALKVKHTKGNDTKGTVVGTLRSHKTVLANEVVVLDERSGKGKSWTDTGQSATTDTSGKVTFTFTQAATKQQYRLVFAGDSSYKKSHSGTITIRRAKQPSAS